MVAINFKKIETADKPIFDKFYRAGYYENAYASFVGLYMWREMSNTRWALDDDIIYLIAEWQGEFSAFQPLCAPEKNQRAIAKIIAMFDECGSELKMYGLEKSFVEASNS